MENVEGNALDDLIEVLQLVKEKKPDIFSPFHCEHDVLLLCVDPSLFTQDEKEMLDTKGFFEGQEYDNVFMSFRYGSA